MREKELFEKVSCRFFRQARLLYAISDLESVLEWLKLAGSITVERLFHSKCVNFTRTDHRKSLRGYSGATAESYSIFSTSFHRFVKTLAMRASCLEWNNGKVSEVPNTRSWHFAIEILLFLPSPSQHTYCLSPLFPTP